jgi:hypothetical protein
MLGINSTASWNTIAVPGRFSGGRSAASNNHHVYTPNPFGALNFGANSFTFEAWIKTQQTNSQRLIMQLHNDYYGTVGNMFLEANGVLSANLWAPNGTQWYMATSRSYNPQTGFWQGKIDDDYWHHIALVLDRTENKLKIFIDGQLQVETAKPANFDVLRDRDAANYSTRFTAYLHQNFTQDEVRILNYPRTAAQIQSTWLGNNNSQPLSLNLPFRRPPEKAISSRRQKSFKPDKLTVKKAEILNQSPPPDGENEQNPAQGTRSFQQR